MTKRHRCFYCGTGMSQKHWPDMKRAKKEDRLLHAIFGRIVCKACWKAGRR